jgi:hypothetical protein
MIEDGWEKVEISHLGDHNITFVSYRDAEREGSIASVSVRLEGSIGPLETPSKKGQMLVRSSVMRVQIDCAKHAYRAVGRYTLYQENNLKGVSRTCDMSSTTPWSPYGGPSSPLMATGSSRSDWDPQSPGREPLAWDVIATTVCAPHGAAECAKQVTPRERVLSRSVLRSRLGSLTSQTTSHMP